MFLLSSWAERLLDRYGAKLLLVGGSVITSVGFALFAVPGIGGTYWTTFFPAVLVLGLGMALTSAPLTTVVMGAVEERHVGIASAINNTVARVACLLAIAVFGIVILSAFNSSLDHHLAGLQLSSDMRHLIDAQRIKLAEIQLPANTDGALSAGLRHAIHEAFVSGFHLISLIGAGLALLGALCAAVMIEGNRSPLRITHAQSPLGTIRPSPSTQSICFS